VAEYSAKQIMSAGARVIAASYIARDPFASD
jgi:hypothetical protein